MTVVTLNTVRHNADGTVTQGTITVDPANPANPKPKARPIPPVPGLTFLGRLTDAEYSTIVQAAQTQLAAGQPQLSRWMDMLRVNGEINVTDAAATAAKTALVQQNLLTQQRADVVFAP